jgi:2'-5' RNA ligase
LTAAAPARVRVFAALNLPPELCNRLGDVIAGLSTSLPHGAVRWVRAAGIHLTLKFYGNVTRERLPELQSVLAQAAESASPISLELQGLGIFPSPIRPRVIWVGLAGDLERLNELQKRVEDASAVLGFKPEPRGFTPHLTLGRVNGNLRSLERQRLAEGLAAAREQSLDLGAFTADTLSLIRSELKPTGSVYTPLFTTPLGSRIA